MRKLWTDRAWEDYLYWQGQDNKKLKRVNQLITDIERNATQESVNLNLCGGICPAGGHAG